MVVVQTRVRVLLVFLVLLLSGCLQPGTDATEAANKTGRPLAPRFGPPSTEQIEVGIEGRPALFSEPGHRYTEFNTASNPSNPDQVAVGVIDWDDPAGSTACAVFTSQDGGKTWKGGIPGPFKRYGLGGDPWVAIDHTGRVHAACIEQRPRGDASSFELWYMHSDDFGATWSPKVQISTRGSGMDKDAMGIDSKGNVYACFSEGPLKVAISRDRGDTWEPPIAVHSELFGNCNGVYEGRSGEIHVGFLSLRGRFPFRGVGTIVSYDEGRTWEEPILADVFHLEPSCSGPSCPSHGMLGTLQSFAVSPVTGTAFVAVNNITRNNTYVLQLSRLEFGKQEFERVPAPNAAPAACARCSAWRPAIAFDGEGRLGMRWYSGPSNTDRSVYFAASTDEGHTWTTPIRLATLPNESVGLTALPGPNNPVDIANGAIGLAQDAAANPRGTAHAHAFGFLYLAIWPIGKDEGGHYDGIAPVKTGFVIPWLAMTQTGAPELHSVRVTVTEKTTAS